MAEILAACGWQITLPLMIVVVALIFHKAIKGEE